MEEDNTALILYDTDSKKKYVFKKNMFINQIIRDGPEIANKIFELYKDEFDVISNKCIKVQSFLLASSISTKESDKITSTLYSLIWNVNNSISALMLLISHGYMLQPMILSRNVIENISVIAHLSMNPNDIDNFLSDKLDSTRTINSLKKLIPPVGSIYGSYSKNFVHISSQYINIETIGKNSIENKDRKIVINGLYFCVWLYYIVAELVGMKYMYIENMLYWKPRDSNSYFFTIPESEVNEVNRFLGDSLK